MSYYTCFVSINRLDDTESAPQQAVADNVTFRTDCEINSITVVAQRPSVITTMPKATTLPCIPAPRSDRKKSVSNAMQKLISRTKNI